MMVLRTTIRRRPTVQDTDSRDANEADVEKKNDSLDRFLKLT